ncbi:hypothetical protein N802_11585 [Knoellia sinensis KCTC 19936]|uniref:Uncharacterized protein n=2 Tax=Knoellia TaxID=136099 RepID=A0A0A0IZ15_9MICO|nr:hypothetical protein N802_11585 [Knoellia sinensis KCTC 19936]
MGVAAVAVLAALGPAPSASASTDDSEAIAKRVYDSANVSEALAELTTDERELFIDRLDEWTAVGSESPAMQRKPTAQEASLGAEALAGGCWYKYHYKEWYDGPFHTGNTWMQANWCSNGSSITSYSLTNRGGQGLRGIAYKGLGGKYVSNVGWEVRQAQQFNFGIGWASAQPCMQNRGGRTGLYSYRSSCNLG